jgi:hypothetical protein
MRMMGHLGNTSLPLVAFLMWSVLAGCGDLFGEKTLSSGPVDGIVVDKVTQKPVAGAVVVATWYGSRSTLVDSSTIWYHVETAIANDNGRFHISGWKIPNIGDWSTRIDPDGVNIWSYAIGYNMGLPTDDQTHKIEMLPFIGTNVERLALLFRFAGQSDGHYDNSIKNLIPLRLAVLIEARAIAKSPGEQHTADRIEWSLSELCYLPPGLRIEDFGKPTLIMPPETPWPPPPCTERQLQER